MKNVPDSEAPAPAIRYLDENAALYRPRAGHDVPVEGAELRVRIRRKAFELGFVRTGFARAEPFLEAGAAFERWIGRGYAGTMQYLAEFGDRADPRRMLPNARTVVVVAMPTTGPIHEAPTGTQGTVADYAMGLDYHIALRGRLERLCDAMADFAGVEHWARPCVDTAPILEREAARRAGIGFVGKSTMLIVPQVGPRVLLGLVVTTLQVDADEPMKTRCGDCSACLEACPTQALVGPYELDARRCISYLTIEHQGSVPRDLRGCMGTCLVGCDLCQAVCPYDRVMQSPVMPSDNAPRARLINPELSHWLEMSSTDYRKITKRTALRRLGRVQLMRNAAIALGNTSPYEPPAVLVRALTSGKSAVVRAHVAWALGRSRAPASREALALALETERDEWVREEILCALAELESQTSI